MAVYTGRKGDVAGAYTTTQELQSFRWWWWWARTGSLEFATLLDVSRAAAVSTLATPAVIRRRSRACCSSAVKAHLCPPSGSCTVRKRRRSAEAEKDDDNLHDLWLRRGLASWTVLCFLPFYCSWNASPVAQANGRTAVGGRRRIRGSRAFAIWLRESTDAHDVARAATRLKRRGA